MQNGLTCGTDRLQFQSAPQVRPDFVPINFFNNKIYKLLLASQLVNIYAPEAFNNLMAAYAKDIVTTNTV